MKGKKILCAGVIAILLLSGCGQQQKAEYIGTETAKNLALSASGISPADAGTIDTDMDERNGIEYYHVTFTSQDKSYEYYIDAVTGVVIDSNTPSSSGEDPSSGTDTPDTSSSNDTAAVSNGNDSSGGTSPSQATASGGTASTVKPSGNVSSGTQQPSSQAPSSAAPSSGSSGNSGSTASSGNTPSYHHDESTQHHTSGSSGSGNSTAPSGGNSTNSAISASKAKQLALAQVPGASASNIAEFETDYDDGRMEYEGKIYYNGREYEFEIDAYSGAFRKWESEPIDD